MFWNASFYSGSKLENKIVKCHREWESDFNDSYERASSQQFLFSFWTETDGRKPEGYSKDLFVF